MDIKRHIGLGTDCTTDKEQRVTGKKRGDNQTSFTKDYQKKYRIRPKMIVLNNSNHMLVYMQNKIYNYIHEK